ncbi:MAG: helix-turn-helix transcriptional regulator [Arcobacteraceae bacterium]
MGAGKRLKEVRKYKGLTQHDFGELLGLKQTQIRDIESEKQQVNVDLAEKLEKNFYINGWWLLTGKGEMLINDEKNLPTVTNTLPSTDVVAINFYPEVYAAAGYGAVNGDHAPKKLHISKIFLDEIINVKKYDKLDIIRVYGDSMEPYVSNGEYVIIEKNPDAKNGETIIASINGEVYIKRFKVDPFKKWIKLTSDNSTYDDIHIEGDNLQLISIMGIVRAKIKPF